MAQPLAQSEHWQPNLSATNAQPKPTRDFFPFQWACLWMACATIDVYTSLCGQLFWGWLAGSVIVCLCASAGFHWNRKQNNVATQRLVPSRVLALATLSASAPTLLFALFVQVGVVEGLGVFYLLLFGFSWGSCLANYSPPASSVLQGIAGSFLLVSLVQQFQSHPLINGVLGALFFLIAATVSWWQDRKKRTIFLIAISFFLLSLMILQPIQTLVDRVVLKLN